MRAGRRRAAQVVARGAPIDAHLVTLSAGDDARHNKVVMWSFPIIKDGLIYVIDIRNGLYVLDYTGPRAGEVAGVDFLEGNSNLGDAGRLAKSAG